jgi:hypothetical protein
MHPPVDSLVGLIDLADRVVELDGRIVDAT